MRDQALFEYDGPPRVRLDRIHAEGPCRVLALDWLIIDLLGPKSRFLAGNPTGLLGAEGASVKTAFSADNTNLFLAALANAV